MNKPTSRQTLLVCSMVFMVLMVPIICGWGRSDKYLQSFWVRWLNNKVDGQIDFYGRVVDQTGSPVEGVKILVHLRKFRFSLPGTPWRVIEFHLKTDALGYFKIIGETGRGVSFYDFKKKGYECVFPHEQSSFNYEQNTTGIFHPDPNHPVIYRMRRKGEETYIVKNERIRCFEYDQKESGTQKGFDLIRNADIQERDFAHPMVGYVPLTCDIKTKADYDPKTNRWKMLVWPGDPKGGIMISPEKWYVAPADGYLPSYTIDPDAFIKDFKLDPANKPIVPTYNCAYVYLKSRTPPVYTRFSISSIRIDEHRLMVSAVGSVTNPYGERNLEPVTGLPVNIRLKLDKEVRECYTSGRRPIKPDIPKLVQAEDKKNEPWFMRMIPGH